MDQLLRLLLMVLIGGFIGYTTNVVALKMLFRPIKPINFGLFKLQGVLPKRKARLGESIGQTIEREFLSKDAIFEQLFTDEMKAEFKETLKHSLTEKIIAFIPSMLRAMLGDDLTKTIHKFIDKEGDNLMNQLVKAIQDGGMERLDIAGLVKRNVDALDMREFERLVKDIVRKELRHIELVGLMLGLMIGFVQFIVTLYT